MQEPEPIDWEYYRKGIGNKVVDMYKEAYDGKFLYFLHLCFVSNFLCLEVKNF